MVIWAYTPLGKWTKFLQDKWAKSLGKIFKVKFKS